MKAIETIASVKWKHCFQSSAQPKEKRKRNPHLMTSWGLKRKRKEQQPEIIVRIITKKLGEKYHKKKGIVKEILTNIRLL